jgi:hypothetical protein
MITGPGAELERFMAECFTQDKELYLDFTKLIPAPDGADRDWAREHWGTASWALPQERIDAIKSAAEPLSEELRGVRGLLGFDLMPGTTFDQAKEIAAYMEKHIKSITLTP